MNWLTIAWIVGGLMTWYAMWAGNQWKSFSQRGKCACVVIGIAVVLSIMLQTNPWIVFLGLAAFSIGVRLSGVMCSKTSERMFLMTVPLILMLSGCSGGSGVYHGNLAADIKANVAKRWEAILKEGEHVAKELDSTGKPPKEQGAKPKLEPGVRKQLKEVRALLLPVNCREILAAVDELDERIVEAKKNLAVAERERIGHPDEADKYTKRVEALNRKKVALEKARAEQAKEVMKNLKGIGLSIPDDVAERCLFPVNVEMWMDNAVVAKDIAEVVRQLEPLMNSDLEMAKRYFGMYLAMIEVQAEGYRMYIEKSEKGEWFNGISKIRTQAEQEKQSDLIKSGEPRFTEAQREGFRRNAETKGRIIEAADAYLEMLRQSEERIREKLTAAENARELAESSWTTVKLASDLLAIMKASDEMFETLMSLELPQLMMFDDTRLQAEFDAITRQLKQE